MRIHSIEESTLEKKTNDQESMKNIVNRIFLICKNNENFQLREQTKEIEGKIKAVEERLNKQNSLLEQANTIQQDMSRRIELLNSENSDEKIRLIESLEG